MLFEGYCDNEIIDLKEELTEVALNIIERLEVKIKGKLYTKYEYEDLKESLGIYCSKYDSNKEQKYIKPLKYGVTKEEYDYIFTIFNEIDNKYKELLKGNCRKINFENIWFREKQHIRDKLITCLEKQTLNNNQRKKIFQIVMSMEDTTLIQKERFIIYYGLDKSKEEIHNATKIAKLQNCTKSTIIQSINKIKSKIPRLSDEKIEIIRNIVNKSKKICI